MRVDLYIEVMYMTFLVPGYNVTALNVWQVIKCAWWISTDRFGLSTHYGYYKLDIPYWRMNLLKHPQKCEMNILQLLFYDLFSRLCIHSAH